MVGNKTVEAITFYYESNEMFNDVSLLSAYMTKNLGSESGAALDELVITDDEREVYDVCLKQALPNIYESMLKMSNGITDAFNDAYEVKEKETSGLKREVGKYIEISINDNRGAYNKNVLSIVDATIRDCIKYGILAEFYSVCVNKSMFSIVQEKFIANMLQLNKRLFQLKKAV